MNTIGERIAELRKQKGMTQEELAGIIGVSAQSVSKWETSATMPDIMLLPVIADIFEITIDELYGKTIVGNSKISFDDVPEEAFDALLSTMQHAWMSDEKNASHFVMTPKEYCNDTKKYLKENHDSQTAIFSDFGGAVWANSELGIIFRKPSGKISEFLSDKSALNFLSALGNDTLRKILAYQIQNNAISFTAASLVPKLGVEESQAEEALALLVKYEFTVCRDIDTGDGHIKTYSLYAGHKMLLIYTIMMLAKRLSDYTEHYRGFRGVANSWFC